MIKATFIPSTDGEDTLPYSDVAAKPGAYGSGNNDFRYLSVFGVVVSIDPATGEVGSVIDASTATLFRRLAGEVDITIS